MNRVPTHPAKFTDSFIPIFSKILIDEHAETVLDPFAGVGKIGAVKKCGYNGVIIANEIEEEWIAPNTYNCDVVLTEDAEKLRLATNSVDAICTSPTYGNRMADHHNAKDGSKRMTYTHCLGRPLTKGNTGEMQWGGQYREKHLAVYKNLSRILKPNGAFILNISNHIRKGEEINVCAFHIETLQGLGFETEQAIAIKTPRMRNGANNRKRVENEWIFVMRNTNE